jgi:hypothetical protein
MIECQPLTETQSPRHFCKRCETWQKRGELHHCLATEAWEAMKADWWAEYNASSKTLADTPPVSSEPVSSPVEEEHFSEPANSPETANTANAEDDVSKPVSTDRKAYMRDLMRRKRAEEALARAKAI